jgi:Domain of unknown function (DUF4276)
VSVRIYVEGGSQGTVKSDCRKAFRLFLEKVIAPGSFKVIASGSRNEAYKDFCAALKTNRRDYVVLLVDSEAEVMAGAWQHLGEREGDKWRRPASTHDDQAHLMVQVMEAWFLADPDVLAVYYGQGFLANSLPGQLNIELIPKQAVFDALRHATKKTQKGEYHKTRHGFDLLEQVEPGRVRAASHHAKRLFTVLAREAAR